PALTAVLTGSAGRPQPGVADHLADFDISDAGADLLHSPHTLMTRNERNLRLDRPVPLRGVQIGVAHTRGDEFDQRLSGTGFGDRIVSDDELLAEALDDCCFHFRHLRLLVFVWDMTRGLGTWRRPAHCCRLPSAVP